MEQPVIVQPSKPITWFRNQHAFLSNFYPCDIRGINGWVFPTVEHAFQCAKVDEDHPAAKHWQARIYKALLPGRAKQYGRQCPLKPTWDAIKIDVMRELLIYKFTHHTHKELAQKLLDTRDAELIEGNDWGDRYWGACWDGERWGGENHLGKLLMEIREGLRSGQVAG